MEKLETIFANPFYAALFAWLAWNFLMLSLHKDENEQSWNFVAYFKDTWNNWIASLLFVPILMYIGLNKINIDSELSPIHEWHEAYYLLAGVLPEIVIKIVKQFRHK